MKTQAWAGMALGVLFLLPAHGALASPYTGADIEMLGVNYSAISSRDMSNTPQSGEKTWYSTDSGAVWTAWGNLWVDYSAFLDVGNWNIGLNVINHGNLGDDGWYSQFEIFNSLSNETITALASDDDSYAGYFNQEITTAGLYTIRYTWKNDKYAKPLDANIQINSAFFDNTATTPVPEPTTLLLMGSGLVGLAARRQHKRT